jgi:hydrogenase maturation protease
LTDTFPRHRALIGIQPDTLGWGDSPSVRVSKAFPEVAAHTLDLLDQWTVRCV